MSIVRENLLSDPKYRPYCGAAKCRHSWPRTSFDGRQFVCKCGWKSTFDNDFMQEYYKRHNITVTGRTPTRPRIQNIPGTLADALDKIHEKHGDGISHNDPWWPDDLGEREDY